ncbi:cytochrome P450 [Sphaerisporangium melleum]|uniref:Cytochrome P450 n=1 Tax=Sphaerisporangium melleum TaxID=321316 RepID=A0A917RDK3_9ACTN|nr:cytochrome P450 [Sphaerisporangium melleum]GGL00837.1 cytochrome P450 [Sphaerisporangium melleum]GII71607.1 cytochrome P450 [Sphaerisporangium melleum]
MSDLPQMPFQRNNALDISPTYRELRKEGPISRVRTQTGGEAWLVTEYEMVRRLLADERLGRSHPDPDSATRVSGSALMGGPSGDYATEKERHQRMRKLLTPAFSARRMKALSGHVQELVSGLLDEMAEKTPPLDLHENFSFPLPVLVICELLGVPFEDREHFRALSDGISITTDPAASAAALEKFSAYILELVNRKRAHPAEDVLSDLAHMEADDQEISRLGAGLLFAGHETTVNSIDFGVVYLLRDLAQRDAVVADPSVVPQVVEEILRIASPSDHGLVRYAKADVEAGEVTIRAGEPVIIISAAANRDENVFAEPEVFDAHRSQPEPHIAFGYAQHYCIGANLARVELNEVFGTLFRRFPTMELAVPAEELRLREGRLTGGLMEVPVTW